MQDFTVLKSSLQICCIMACGANRLLILAQAMLILTVMGTYFLVINTIICVHDKLGNEGLYVFVPITVAVLSVVNGGLICMFKCVEIKISHCGVHILLLCDLQKDKFEHPEIKGSKRMQKMSPL